jgi:hypothetical protein
MVANNGVKESSNAVVNLEIKVAMSYIFFGNKEILSITAQ